MPSEVPADDPETRRTKIRANAATSVAAIFAVCALEWVALYQGIDGAYFAPVVAVVAGLGGYKAADMLRSSNE